MVPIQIEDANLEIMARIVKAASHKYNCDVEIDFSNGVRKVVFTGNEAMKEFIAEEVLDIFESREEEACSLR
jgi:metal-dependent amidase/aminoacylase/carboxypeptidase family protein